MLAMDNASCAVCKEKTSKRMVRNAPVRYSEVVKYLRVLEGVLEDANLRPKDTPVVNDGFEGAANAALLGMPRAPHPAAPTHKRCYLCPKGVDAVAFGGSVAFGPIFPAAAEKKRLLFVHERCANFSEGVYEESGRFHNVQKLVVKTNKIVCGRDACGRARANIQCAADGCGRRYHFPCAVVEGCALVEDGFKLFCTQHRDLAPVIDDTEFQKTLGNPEDATTKGHEDDCYLCGSGGRMLMCDTCERVSHPVCSGLKNIPEGDWSCGVCAPAKPVPVEEKKTPSAKRRGVKRKKGSAASPGSAQDEDYVPSHTAGSVPTKRTRRIDDRGKRYVIAHTGLRSVEKEILKIAAKVKKAMIRTDVDRRVTYMVIRAQSTEDTPIRTMKLCKAVAARIPIMCWKWVQKSMKADVWVAAEAYVHPLTWPKDKPPVFESMRFFFGWYNGSKEMRDDLMSVVSLGGGIVVNREPSEDLGDGEATMCVVDEERQKKERTDSSRRDLSGGGKEISSTWILDQCTKNRNL